MKKGEISSTTLVGIILVIAGAILIGVVIFAFFENSGDNRELCRLSIITRATAPTAAQSNIPLNCVTEKICLTTERGEDNCFQFSGEEINKRSVRIPDNREEAIQEILEVNANALYDCWRMTGQGKLDIFGKAFQTYKEVETKCIVCSRVALAEDVKERFPGIENDLDLNEYLRTTNVPNSDLTYLQVFTGSSGINTYVDVNHKEVEESLNQAKDRQLEGETLSASLIENNFDQIAFVFAQRKTTEGFTKGTLIGLRDSSIVVVGGGVTSGIASAAVKVIGGLPALVIGLVTVGGTSLYAGINSLSQQMASVAYCGEFESSLGEGEASREGCSVIRGVPYNAEYVNQLCEDIEGDL